jgi:indolepyruvate ferredoxin oxidoreductase
VDQELWRAKTLLSERRIEFLPAINEELGATAVMGSQQVEANPTRKVAGVFAMWYGKGPGVDRAGDALKHGHVYGSSPHGGVLAILGDDHGCVSSSMPHQSEQALIAWGMPVINPANIQEYLEFGLYGWALSRYSGAWCGFKAISETVEGGAVVELPAMPSFAAPLDYTPPPDGLHNRWPDLPGLALEQRVAAKLEAVQAFARANSIDRLVVPAPGASIGIIGAGKAYLDLIEALERMGLPVERLAELGVRLYKPGLTYPLERTRLSGFAEGLQEILVVEEKGPVIEQQVKNLFYNLAPEQRPAVIGKTDRDGEAAAVRAGRAAPLAHRAGTCAVARSEVPALDLHRFLPDFCAAELPFNALDGVRRTPYFCSGCPHNTSTRVPEGSRALAGIGCHFMATWMQRDTYYLSQMGGEGVSWAGTSPFVGEKHIFQNLGDGTYYHSGSLAIRQAVAAGINITYKILYNDAVAMTGGQPVDGTLSVPQILQQVISEGAKKAVVVTDYPDNYEGVALPEGVTVHHRGELDAIQRQLREIPGVTVLVYDQTCAAEKRRRRKKNKPDNIVFPDPAGACSSTRPCAKAAAIAACSRTACPSCRWKRNWAASARSSSPPATRITPASKASARASSRCWAGRCASRPPKLALADLERALDAYPTPAAAALDRPFEILVAGVGGTGVVTVGALITMAAHLEGKGASTLDFMGFAQKGGAVLSHVRVASSPERLHQVRIDLRQADAVFACDLVVASMPDGLAVMRHGHTRVVANEHEIPTADFHARPRRTGRSRRPDRQAVRRGRTGEPAAPECAGDGLELPRRSDRQQYPADGLCLAAGAGAGGPAGADAGHRTEWRGGRHEQARLHAGAPARR